MGRRNPVGQQVSSQNCNLRGNGVCRSPFLMKGFRMNNIFELVKSCLTTRQAAESYGIQVSRNGMCRCPFHDDHTPSMKVDRRYYCFGCGATGDVIDFAGKLLRLSPYEAAKRLAQDFGIGTNGSITATPKQVVIENQNLKLPVNSEPTSLKHFVF